MLYGELAILRSMATFLYQLPESFNWKIQLYEYVEKALGNYVLESEQDSDAEDDTEVGPKPLKTKLLNTAIREQLDVDVKSIATMHDFRARPDVQASHGSTRRTRIVKRLQFNKSEKYGSYDAEHGGDADDVQIIEVEEEVPTPSDAASAAFENAVQAEDDRDFTRLASQLKQPKSMGITDSDVAEGDELPQVPAGKKKVPKASKGKKTAAAAAAEPKPVTLCPGCHFAYEGFYHDCELIMDL